jgi:hypothetical protein
MPSNSKWDQLPEYPMQYEAMRGGSMGMQRATLIDCSSKTWFSLRMDQRRVVIILTVHNPIPKRQNPPQFDVAYFCQFQRQDKA